MQIKSDELKPFDWEGLSITDYTSGKNTQSSFAKIEILPGAQHKISWSKVSEKLYYVQKGQLHFMIDNKDFVINEGDLCIIPIKSKFAYKNKTNEVVEILLIHSPGFNIENEVFEGEYF